MANINQIYHWIRNNLSVLICILYILMLFIAGYMIYSNHDCGFAYYFNNKSDVPVGIKVIFIAIVFTIIMFSINTIFLFVQSLRKNFVWIVSFLGVAALAVLLSIQNNLMKNYNEIDNMLFTILLCFVSFCVGLLPRNMDHSGGSQMKYFQVAGLVE